jgi:hypothetical protein
MTYKVVNMSPFPTRIEKLAAIDHSLVLPSLNIDQLPLFSSSGDSSIAEYPIDMDDVEEINPHSSLIKKFEEYTTMTPFVINL